MRRWIRSSSCPGLTPASTPFLLATGTWMAGTSPAMTDGELLTDARLIRARLRSPTHRLCHSDRDQRGAGVLSAGAHHARRSACSGAAGGCVAGAGGAIAHGLWL